MKTETRAGMIGFYLYYTGKRIGTRPEDRPTPAGVDLSAA
jgi:hypothetical protein